ncbi:hypothetical protein AB0C29_25390 [Actinoplanes sp. NPDC048791]|uniref:hypothetical protein n=1 Tax=Actinoplanes sp. NPDC048791 TaxID=3154623 RepID=UPI0033C69619
MAVRTIDREAVRAWRPRSGGRLVAPDGSTLTVKHADSGLIEPWFTENRVRFSGTPEASSIGGRAFETGPAGTVDGHVAVLLNGKYVAEYPAQGGTYLLAANVDGSVGLVAWQGRWHEAYCWVNEPRATHAQMLSKLDDLTFADAPAGLQVGLPSGQSWQRITAFKHLPPVGYLTVRKAATEEASLPAWSGHRVAVGEVWRQISDAKEAAPKPVMVCATPTAVATLNPRESSEDEALAFLTGLSALHWK